MATPDERNRLTQLAREWLSERNYSRRAIRDADEEVLADFALAQMAEREPCKSPDHLLCDNQNNHPENCHCDDPLYWKAEASRLRQALEEVNKQLKCPARNTVRGNQHGFAVIISTDVR